MENILQPDTNRVRKYFPVGSFICPCYVAGNVVTRTTCGAADFRSKIKPIFRPIEMEYSLLSMIFIGYLWPDNKTNYISNNNEHMSLISQCGKNRCICLRNLFTCNCTAKCFPVYFVFLVALMSPGFVFFFFNFLRSFQTGKVMMNSVYFLIRIQSFRIGV